MQPSPSTSRPVAAITGASSGIGFELAKEFATNGHDLIVCAEDDAIHEAGDELARLGVKVDAVRADLSTYEGVEALYRAIRAAGPSVEAIAINAGVGVGGDFARETRLED